MYLDHTASGQTTGHLDLPHSPSSLFFAVNSERLFAIVGKEVTVLNPRTAAKLHQLQVTGRPLAASGNGMQLASGGDNGYIHLWDVAKAKKIQSIQQHSSQVKWIGFLPGARQMKSIDVGHNVCSWRLQ